MLSMGPTGVGGVGLAVVVVRFADLFGARGVTALLSDFVFDSLPPVGSSFSCSWALAHPPAPISTRKDAARTKSRHGAALQFMVGNSMRAEHACQYGYRWIGRSRDIITESNFFE
jgi:hypothetical protein